MPIVDPPVKKQTYVRVYITLPDQVVEQYEKQVKASKGTLEKLLEDRLRLCVNYTAIKPLYFNDAERQKLQDITGGHLIDNIPQVLDRIRSTVSVKVGDVVVTIPPQILDRARARAQAFRLSTEDWLKKEIEQNLERSVGLRP
jgi:hypothetical protein